MERPVPPYEGGKGDDNFAIYQANKLVWRAKHLHEKVIAPLQKELKIENYGRRTKIIKEFNERLLTSYPYIKLCYKDEFPSDTRDALGALLPADYRKATGLNSYDWRYNAKALLNANIGNRIPGLQEKINELYEPSDNRQALEDGANRAVNNFLYAAKENLTPPKESTSAYKKEFKEFLRGNRLDLIELLGAENTHKIKVCLDYLWAVFKHSSILGPRYFETKNLLGYKVSREIKEAIQKDRSAREDPVLRQRAVEFVLDEVFGDDLRDIEEMQD